MYVMRLPTAAMQPLRGHRAGAAIGQLEKGNDACCELLADSSDSGDDELGWVKPSVRGWFERWHCLVVRALGFAQAGVIHIGETCTLLCTMVFRLKLLQTPATLGGAQVECTASTLPRTPGA